MDTTGQLVVAGVPSTTLIGSPKYAVRSAGFSLLPQSVVNGTSRPTRLIHSPLLASVGKRAVSSMRVLKIAFAGNISQSPNTGEPDKACADTAGADAVALTVAAVVPAGA